MQLKITQEKENPLLSRKEVYAEVSFDKATPSNAEIGKAIADKLSSKEELVVIKKIKGGFGTTTASIHAHVYKDKEQKERIEPKVKAAAPAPGAAPAAK